MSFIGKWYKEDEQETLNIIPDADSELGFRLKMSTVLWGCYNFKPNCFYLQDDFLCYEINDEAYRRIYKVKKDNSTLIGFYTQEGKTKPICYKFISETPEDEPEYNKKVNVPGTDQTRLEILNEYATYSDKPDEKQYDFEYTLSETIPDIVQSLGYAEYMDTIPSNSDEMAFTLLHFICDNFTHDGVSSMPTNRTLHELIQFTRDHGNKINCRGLAMMLAGLLRMNGMKASHVTCKPYEDPFDECHVVVDCFLPSGKRVMLDPTYRLYLKNDSGEWVSLPVLREILLRGERMNPNAEASYNGQSIDMNFYREYMTKNTFRFSKPLRLYDGCEEGISGKVELIPMGYPTEAFTDADKSAFVYNENEFWKPIG